MTEYSERGVLQNLKVRIVLFRNSGLSATGFQPARLRGCSQSMDYVLDVTKLGRYNVPGKLYLVHGGRPDGSTEVLMQSKPYRMYRGSLVLISTAREMLC